MIKHTLQEGNRVRVTTHEGAVHCQYCEKSYLWGETGIVVSVNPNFADVGIKLKDKEIECIEEVDYRCLKRIDRTFEEIVKELAEKPEIKKDFPRLVIFSDGHADLDSESAERLSIWPNGDMNGYGMTCVTAVQLAAFAAACSEIAAIYKAEHANDNRHE